MYEVITAALTAAGVSAGYAIYGYLTGKFGGNGSDFDVQKAAGTVLVGAGLGAFAYLMGMPMDQASMMALFGTIGIVEVGQKLIKPIWNYLVNFPKASEVAAK